MVSYKALNTVYKCFRAQVKGVNAFGIMKNPEKGEIKSQKESLITTMQDFLPLYP